MAASLLACCVGFFGKPPPPPPPPPQPDVLSTIVAITVGLLAVILVIVAARLKGGRSAQRDRGTSAENASDPRDELFDFFGAGDKRGPRGLLRNNSWSKRRDSVSDFFSVWRPTSVDAIEMMVDGRATGKGLNVKGKSAKKGRLSGFVPFLQISEESHKRLISTAPPQAMLRIYYASASLRAAARAVLQSTLDEMLETARRAQAALLSEVETGEELERTLHLRYLSDLTRLVMEHPELRDLDACAGRFGLEVPERLMWEAYVTRRDISHPPGWETGRASEPDYMDMNLHSTRKTDPEQPRVVVYQYDEADAMNPRGLLVAYEENQRVQPVASDFDAFLFGSRGMAYPPVPAWQLPFLESMILHTEAVLAQPDARSWTHRWLDVLKGKVELRKDGAPFESAIAGTIGKKRKDGRFGFGDELSQALVRELMHHSSVVRSHGAVRHAAECFNYYFPQELDDEFLVLWHGYDAASVQRRYLSPAELRAFLLARVADGYVFPLNPTWILRDEGWYDVYEAQCAAAPSRPALDSWLPPGSGLRERIRDIHAAYPRGFQRVGAAGAPAAASVAAPPGAAGAGRIAPTTMERPSEEAYERADLELRRYLTFKRAKLKTRAILLWNEYERKTNPQRNLGHDLLIASTNFFDDLNASLKTLGSSGDKINRTISRGVKVAGDEVGKAFEGAAALRRSLTRSATQALSPRAPAAAATPKRRPSVIWRKAKAVLAPLSVRKGAKKE